MGSSIIAAMLLMTAAGEGDAVPVTVVVSVVVLASLGACWAYLRRTTEPLVLDAQPLESESVVPV